MIAYRYNPETMLYEGTQQCQLDPLESEKAGRNIYLLPANCTLTVPLETREGYNIIWNGSSWKYVEMPMVQESEPTPPTLEEVKTAKISELKNIRDTKELEPILYAEHWFDFDLKSYNRITAAADVLDRADLEYQRYIDSLPTEEPTQETGQESENNNPSLEENTEETIPNYPRPSIMWTTADNDNVELTADGLHGIIQAAAARSNELHVRYRLLKNAVSNASDIPAVQGITWSNLEDYI